MEIGEVVTTTITVTATGSSPVEVEVVIGNYEGPEVLTIIQENEPISTLTSQTSSLAPASALAQFIPQGTLAYSVDAMNYNLLSFDTDTPGSLTSIGPIGSTIKAADFLNGDFSKLYALTEANQLVTINTTSGQLTNIGNSSPGVGRIWTGMAEDTSTGVLYASSTHNCGESTIYQIEPASGEVITIGNVPNAACLIAIAIGPDGQMYGLDILNDNLLAINKNNGASTIIGSVGFNAGAAQMDFDETTDTLYLAAFYSSSFSTELRTVDVETGLASLVGILGAPGDTNLETLAIASSGANNSSWVSATPETFTIPANSSTTFELVFDTRSLSQVGQYTAQLTFEGNFVNVVPTMPLTMNVSCPTCGFLDGTITDEETGDPVESQIYVTGPNGFEANVFDSTYNWAVQPGVYDISVNATGYLPEVTTITASQGITITTDFELTPDVARLEYSPVFIEEFMEIGDVVTNSVAITNTGAHTLTYQVNIDNYEGPEVLAIIQENGHLSIPSSDGNFPKANTPSSAGVAPQTGRETASTSSAPTLAQLIPQGVLAYGSDASADNIVFFDTSTPGSLTALEYIGGNNWGADFLNGDFSKLYALIDFNKFVTIDTATGEVTLIAPSAPTGVVYWSGMAGDPTTGNLYASATNSCVDDLQSVIYQINPATGELTTIGTVPDADCLVAIAIGSDGQMYGLDTINDNLIAIDKNTGASTVIGSVGFDANYGQGMDFDETTNTLYLAAYNNTTSSAELRIADLETGNTILVGNLGTPGVTQIGTLAIATGETSLSQWASAVPAEQLIPPYSTSSFEVVFDARSIFQLGEYTADLIFDGNFVNVVPSMPLTMNVNCPACGFLEGAITTDSTGNPLMASIVITDGINTEIELFEHSYNVAVAPGTYKIWVSANGYATRMTEVTVTTKATTTTNFALPLSTGILEYTPAGFEEVIHIGHVATESLTLSSGDNIAFYYHLTDEEQPGGSDAAWLGTNPMTGTIAAGGSANVEVVLDGSVITQTGTYTAHLLFNGSFNNTVEPAMVVLYVTQGLLLSTDQAKVGIPGETVTYMVGLTNTSDITHTIAITLSGHSWDSTTNLTTTVIPAGGSIEIMVVVEIPLSSPHQSDKLTLKAQSMNEPNAWDEVELTTKVRLLYLPIINH